MEHAPQIADGTDRRSVTIPWGNKVLTGVLQLPRAAPGVVLFPHVSGSLQQDLSAQWLAQALSSAGLGTLRLALLTPAEDQIDQQTRHLRFDLPLLARRLVSATEWLAQQPELVSRRFGYCAASTGAAVVLLAAAELGARLSAVVCYDGRPDLAGDALARVTAPTLLLVGELDRDAGLLNRAALVWLPGPKTLQLIPAATRLFNEPACLPQVATHAAQWFHQHLFSHPSA